MSTLKDFQEKLASDEAFASKFDNVKSPEELVALASKEGYNFTVEELKGGLNDTIELSEDELEAVAGGTGRYVSYVSTHISREKFLEFCKNLGINR